MDKRIEDDPYRGDDASVLFDADMLAFLGFLHRHEGHHIEVGPWERARCLTCSTRPEVLGG